MPEDCCFVAKVIRTLALRGGDGESSRMVQENLASKTLRWFDYFVEFFIEHNPPPSVITGSMDWDDLLFFVRDQPRPGEEQIFVKRKLAESKKLPKLEGLVLWEETFYVNLIARLNCQLRVTVCERKDSRMIIVREAIERVFAEPTKGAVSESKVSPFECSFPQIYFSVNNCHDNSVFGEIQIGRNQILCVEVRAIFGEGQREEEESYDSKANFTAEMKEKKVESHKKEYYYEAWGDDKSPSPSLSLFQGAVTYEALAKVHKKKAGLRAGAPQRVLMRGPEGHGYAQVQVINVEAASKDNFNGALQFFRDGLNRIYSDISPLYRDKGTSLMTSSGHKAHKVFPHMESPKYSMEGDNIKRRRRLQQQETELLLRVFEQYQRPTAAMRDMLASRLGMSARGVQIWFQNRRAKVKRDLLESGQGMLLFGPTATTGPGPGLGLGTSSGTGTGSGSGSGLGTGTDTDTGTTINTNTNTNANNNDVIGMGNLTSYHGLPPPTMSPNDLFMEISPSDESYTSPSLLSSPVSGANSQLPFIMPTVEQLEDMLTRTPDIPEYCCDLFGLPVILHSQGQSQTHGSV